MLKGKLGFKGERGYSAYEVAVQNGFEGTEQDWLDTIGCPISPVLNEESTNGTVPGSKTVFDYINERTNDNNIEIPIILDHEYTLDDKQRATHIYMGAIEPTEEDYRLYDLNGDGVITNADVVAITNIINGRIVIPEDKIVGKIIIKSDGCLSRIEMKNILYDESKRISLGAFVFDGPNYHGEISDYAIKIRNSDKTKQITLDCDNLYVKNGNNDMLDVGVFGENSFGIRIQGSSKTTTITENGVSTVNN